MADRHALTYMPSFMVWANPADVTVTIGFFWRKETNWQSSRSKCVKNRLRGACSNSFLTPFFLAPLRGPDMMTQKAEVTALEFEGRGGEFRLEMIFR